MNKLFYKVGIALGIIIVALSALSTFAVFYFMYLGFKFLMEVFG